MSEIYFVLSICVVGVLKVLDSKFEQLQHDIGASSANNGDLMGSVPSGKQG